MPMIPPAGRRPDGAGPTLPGGLDSSAPRSGLAPELERRVVVVLGVAQGRVQALLFGLVYGN